MAVAKTRHKLAAGTAAAIVSATVAFTPQWEGYQLTAAKDKIGTGHPMTYCIGQTDEFGAVKAGTKFTKAYCDQKLFESLSKQYLPDLEPCINVDLPIKVWASFLDGSYNAGTGAMCKSPMVRLANQGKLVEACKAFQGWYIRSAGQIRTGLMARRSGRPGDVRKSEMQYCLDGVREGLPKEAEPAAVPAKKWWKVW